MKPFGISVLMCQTVVVLMLRLKSPNSIRPKLIVNTIVRISNGKGTIPTRWALR